ncbi:4Fe-4S dicluster domain-containing protein [Desulforhopalus sp. 52FAK]
MKRRKFLQFLGGSSACLSLLPVFTHSSFASVLKSPVVTNRLRPPGAVPEEIFPAKCIRCGRCVEVCPYRSITMLDIRSGVHAGTPLIEAEKIPCYLCMKCVDVCPTGSLKRIKQTETRMGCAVINKFVCAAWEGKTMCRTCYDKCPFPEKAIRLDQLRPVIDKDACTGCGLCTHACPVTTVDGKKAVNIEPLYAKEKVTQ